MQTELEKAKQKLVRNALIILMSETFDKTTILYLPCKKFQTLLSLLLSYIFEKRTLTQIFLKA